MRLERMYNIMMRQQLLCLTMLSALSCSTVINYPIFLKFIYGIDIMMNYQNENSYKTSTER